MAYKDAETLIEAMLYATAFSLLGRSEKPFPYATGMIGMLATAGLHCTQMSDGFDIEDIATGEICVRVRVLEIDGFTNLFVDPASIVFKALRLIEQPITYAKSEAYQ